MLDSPDSEYLFELATVVGRVLTPGEEHAKRLTRIRHRLEELERQWLHAKSPYPRTPMPRSY